MKLMGFLLLAVLGFSQVASASITFQLAPASQQILQGSTGAFTLSLISSVPAGELVDSTDFNANAGIGNGTQGVFVAPTATVILANLPVDYTSTPGQAFGSNFLAGGISVPSGSGILLANLFLDTTGVALGNYTMSLDSLGANSPTFGGLSVAGSTVNYEVISAVPDPSSVLTALALGGGGLFYRRRRGKMSKSKKLIAKA